MLYLELVFISFDTELTEHFEQYDVVSFDICSFSFELFFELHPASILVLLLILLFILLILLLSILVFISSKESFKF